MDAATFEQPCVVCATSTRTVVGQIFLCNACTAFFRRSVSLKKALVCLRKNDCDITKELRNSCRACRLKKCYEIGLKMEGNNLFVEPERSESSSTNNYSNALELYSISPNSSLSTDSGDMTVVYPTLNKKVGFFRMFQHRQKSLFHVHNPNKMFQNSYYEMAPVSMPEYHRMESGTLQMVCMMAADCLDLCSKMERQDKINVLKSCALQISLLHKGYLTSCVFPELGDRRLVSHFGYFIDLNNMATLCNYSIDANERERILRPGYEAMYHCSQKFRMFGLTEIEVAFLSAVICLEEVENHGFLNTSWRVFRDALYAEMHNYMLSVYGTKTGPVRLVKLVSLMHNVANLHHAYNDMLTLVSVFLDDPKDLQKVEHSFLESMA